MTNNPRRKGVLDRRWTRLARATPTARPELSQLILGVLVVLLATLVAVKGPMVALQLVAVVLVVVLSVKRPEYVLAVGVAGRFAGSQFTQVSYTSGLVLLLGACTSVFIMATSQLPVRWQRMVLPVMILVWFGLRVSLEQDFHTVAAVAVCAASLVMVLHCLHSRRDVVVAMAAGGFLFTMASAWFGIESASGLRFEGISGNPNRMVFGLLVYLPFFVTILSRRRAFLLRILSLAASIVAVRLVLLSGSDQGLVGLAVIVLVLLMCWAAGLPPAVRPLVLVVFAIGLVLAASSAFSAIQSSRDLRTLSGRTSIYAAAIQDIARNPLAGSGEQRFSDGVVMDRSAHSVTLALASTGGLLLGLAWVAVLIMLLATTIVLVRRRSPLAAAPAVLITVQLVQTVQLVSCTWVVVGWFLVTRSLGDLGETTSSARPRPDRRVPTLQSAPPDLSQRFELDGGSK